MKLIQIGKEQVPAIGLGTYQLTGKEGELAISNAIRIGYRHLDTAQFYRNEEIVGNAVRKSGKERKEFFITTKIWPSDFTKRNFIPKVEQSLRELNVGYIDLLLLHWPGNDSSNDLACELLNDCIHKGYTRLVGVSNFSMAQLKRAQSLMPVFCNQVEYNPYTNQHEMVEYGSENNLLITAYTPLARGKVNKDATLISIGEKYGKSPAQIALRWFLQQKNVSPIPKAGNEKHLKENMDIEDFQLTEEDMNAIFNLYI
ncbi:MAG TPA: aldo/keto reductase [Bacteroidia bacterium]|jgi:2,5-diketo-D-gluconate reductase B|nr:aldo/keto reductase [Bacteroidia bacterium]